MVNINIITLVVGVCLLLQRIRQVSQELLVFTMEHVVMLLEPIMNLLWATLTAKQGNLDPIVTWFTVQGDKYWTGDNAQIKNSAGTWVNISNTLNPVNNAMNATVTDNDEHMVDKYPGNLRRIILIFRYWYRSYGNSRRCFKCWTKPN